ncbi:MAG: MBL fold metallo-hydrolase [Pseudomonadales bacterium]|nr:MBL fold metallo-hydrolase [Pseudomonadales bacterium]
MADYREFATLSGADFPPAERALFEQAAPIGEWLIDALPDAEFDPAAYTVAPTTVTRALDAGEILDLGDRHFEVLHLPGHSPGSMGLWEAASGTLFSGDAIYDGVLLDELPDSHIADYIQTMKRLRELPVVAVHGGHEPSFGRARLIELVDDYLALRDG